MRILKALSVLLSYPDAETLAALPEIEAEVGAAAALPACLRERLAMLAREIAAGDLITAQERYVALFDQSRSLSLHLFEHVHGESRDRGQAMVDLRRHYERHGLTIATSELPDYLPLLLEFASTRERQEAIGLLAEVRGIVATLAERLKKRRSAYAAAMDAIAILAGVEAASQVLATPEADAASGPALDRAWDEKPVTFREPEEPIECSSPPCYLDEFPIDEARSKGAPK
jgi:nitrate reductase molybdenum cofactor assembly chaperone NarJ/NarW